MDVVGIDDIEGGEDGTMDSVGFDDTVGDRVGDRVGLLVGDLVLGGLMGDLVGGE